MSKKGQNDIEKNWGNSIPSTELMLDRMLKYLASIDGAVSDYEFEKEFKTENIKSVNIRQCTTQLIKDGFVGQIDGRDLQFAPHTITYGDTKVQIKKAQDTIPAYYITFEGKKFITNGGYSSLWLKIKRIIKKNWFSILSLIIGFIGIGLAYVSQQDRKEVQEIQTKVDSVAQVQSLDRHQTDSLNIKMMEYTIEMQIIQNNYSMQIDSIIGLMNKIKVRQK